jgi:hypothetical protein
MRCQFINNESKTSGISIELRLLDSLAVVLFIA